MVVGEEPYRPAFCSFLPQIGGLGPDAGFAGIADDLLRGPGAHQTSVRSTRQRGRHSSSFRRRLSDIDPQLGRHAYAEKQAGRADAEWLHGMLQREGRALGTRVELTAHGVLDVLWS